MHHLATFNMRNDLRQPVGRTRVALIDDGRKHGGATNGSKNKCIQSGSVVVLGNRLYDNEVASKKRGCQGRQHHVAAAA